MRWLLLMLVSLGAPPLSPISPRSPISMGPTRAPAASSKVFLTVEEALRLAFPGCEIERRTVYLTEEQKQAAQELARVELESSIVRPYVATKKGKLVGRAYFDTHDVRTKRETVMIAVEPGGKILRLELLAFAEPVDYIPRGKWYGQFKGKRLDAGLSLKRDIKGVTGATLTARATTNAARRSLALHEVLFGKSDS